MKLKENKKLILSIIIIVLIISIAGGSLAKWSWGTDESQKTLVNISLGESYLTIIGNNVEKTGMYPTKNCNGEAALIGEIATATAENNTNLDMEAIIKIRTSLSLSQGSLSDNDKGKINWAVVDTSTGTTCETTPYKGDMSGVTTNTDLETGIRFRVPANQTVSKNYRIYVWVDSTYTHTNEDEAVSDPMQNLGINVTFSPASELDSAQPNSPVLDDSMIPVKISADGIATTVSSTDSSWYNYENKEWANAVLVKSNGLQTRDYYKSNTGVTVAEDDILAYYVWIPRYKYKIWTINQVFTENSIEIVFETANARLNQGTKVGEYKTHPAFIWDGNSVAGIWVGKFETSHSILASSTTNNNLGCTNENCSNADGLIIKPDVVSLRYNNISNFFYASRSMTRSGNPFGLSSATTDTHMMKNTEWGSVAYLSHSKYGINQEIYSNNSSGHYTGRSGGNVGGSVNSNFNQFGSGSTSTVYNSYGYYTWTGQTISISGTINNDTSDRKLGTNASTSGNVTGIYDMSGGSEEYVMGNYQDMIGNSGFTTLPNSKYYDKYETDSNYTACNNGKCFGHATFEVWNWYYDSPYDSFEFLDPEGNLIITPWYLRGKRYFSSRDVGIFAIYSLSGEEYSENSFRVVAIVRK